MIGLDLVVQKLLYFIMQFNKGKWRQYKFYGCNYNEIMVLVCLFYGLYLGECLDWRDNFFDFNSELNEDYLGLKVLEISVLL